MERFEARSLAAKGRQVLLGISLLLTGAGALAATALLTPGPTIAGGRIEPAINVPAPLNTQVPLNMQAPLQRRPEFAGYLALMSPAAIAVRGSYLYVVDTGRQQIFRYDLMRQTMLAFANYPAAKATGLVVAPDQSVYVADSGAQKVLHFSIDGKLLQTFGNARELTRPAAVALDERNGQVLVADALYNQVVVFNSMGLLLDILKSSEARSIVAMVRGPAGLYLVDRIGRSIIVLGPDGQQGEAFGADSLKDPAAIAVDRHGRVFVADNFDRSIKVYVQGQLSASVGGSDGAPVVVSRIGGLWLEQDTLYVADSLNGRVQSFMVAAPEPQGTK